MRSDITGAARADATAQEYRGRRRAEQPPEPEEQPATLSRVERRAAERATRGRGAPRSPGSRPRGQVGRHAGAPARQQPARAVRLVGAAVAVGVIGASAVVAHALPGTGPAGGRTSAASLGIAPAGDPEPEPEQSDGGELAAGSARALAGGALSAVPAPLKPTMLRMTAVSRAKERSAMPGCDAKNVVLNHPNGQIPDDELCTIPWAPRHHLRADAAIALAKLDVAYDQKFGKDLCITDSYRSLASQISLAARKPALAARPGHSEHGWGLAVDLCDGGDRAGTARHDWLMANAPAFGWQNPDWAQPNGSRPEAWHWEYVAGEAQKS